MMDTVADFFFIAGLQDDYNFDFGSANGLQSTRRASSPRNRRSEQEETFNQARRASRISASIDESVELGSKHHQSFSAASDDAQSSISYHSAKHDTPYTDPVSTKRVIDQAFQIETFSLGKLSDPLSSKRHSRSVSDDLLAVVDETVFSPSNTSNIESARRDRTSMMSSSSTMKSNSCSLRDRKDGSSTYRRSNSKKLDTASSIGSRPVSQIYSSVIPDPEPLILPAGTHPLKQKFAPQLLAKYPPMNSAQAQVTFPAYIPMFCFPDDITVQMSDERPRSIWHTFSLTNADGEPMYGATVITWLPLKDDKAEMLESQCAEWRKQHMPLEKQEMSISISEKLANERTVLSSLLLQLSQSSVDDYDDINEKINQCEDRIALYAELLKPIRHGARANISGLTTGAGVWMPRALGLLGRNGACQSAWRSWLQAIAASYLADDLQRIPSKLSKSIPWLPLERYAINICQEARIRRNSRLETCLSVRSCPIVIPNEIPQRLPGSVSVDLYPLFRALSLDKIIVLYQAALLESRIIFMSDHTAMLSLAAAALISLLFPFTWHGVFIPVLPRRLISCLEAPTPFIMGFNKSFANVELPEAEDIVICDLDENTLKHNLGIRLPAQVERKLTYFLSASAPLHSRYIVPYGPPPYCTESFPFDAVSGPASFKSRMKAKSKLADLITSSSSTFVLSNLSGHDRPNLNMFATYEAFPGLDRTDGRGSTAPAELSHSRPPLRTSMSSFAATLRAKPSRNSISNRDDLPFRARPLRHISSPSVTTLADTSPSIYARSLSQSTFAASTFINFDMDDQHRARPGFQTENYTFKEGHQMRYQKQPNRSRPDRICDYSLEVIEAGCYICTACSLTIAEKHIDRIAQPCLPVAFDSDKVRASFVRCISTLLQNYRKYLVPVLASQASTTKDSTAFFKYDRAAHMHELTATGNNAFMLALLDTQLWAAFIDERVTRSASDPAVLLFDHILLAKRNRGRSGLFTRSDPWFLREPTQGPDHVVRIIEPNNAPWPADVGGTPQDWEVPDHLDERLFTTPRLFDPR